METKQIKSEIRALLENVPANVLHDILEILRLAENQTNERFNLIKNLKDILSEDKDLLERLAK